MMQQKPGKNSRLQKQVFDTLYLLRIVISNTRLYSLDHPKTREMIIKAFTSLNKTLFTTRELTILIIDNDLIINNRAIRPEESDYFALFITVLKQKNIGHVTFKRGLTMRELTHFLTDLSSKSTRSVYNGPGISSGKLGLKEDPHDSLTPDSPLFTENTSGSAPSNPELMAKLKSLSNKQLLLAQELYFSIKKEKNLDLRGVQDSMSSFVTLFSRNLNPLSLLTPLKSNDDYTFTHVINVCILTMAQAESLGFKDQNLYDIGITATLYDIGKSFIPEEILNKAGPLDTQEQETVKEHSAKGAEYLLGIAEAPKLAVLAALEHHIRFDGGGYPDIGRSWKTNIVSQMIAVADTYDAMRCQRPYRRPNSEQIIKELLGREKGKLFNPFLVDNFLSLLSRNRD